jgi:hypothetical protein
VERENHKGINEMISKQVLRYRVGLFGEGSRDKSRGTRVARLAKFFSNSNSMVKTIGTWVFYLWRAAHEKNKSNAKKEKD